MEYPPFEKTRYLTPALTYGTTLDEAIADLWSKLVTRLRTGTWDDLLELVDLSTEPVDWQWQCELKEHRPEDFAGVIGQLLPCSDEYARGYAEKMLEEALKWRMDESALDFVDFGSLERAVKAVYSALKPPKPSKTGQIGKLGGAVAYRIKQWLEGEKSSVEVLTYALGALLPSSPDYLYYLGAVIRSTVLTAFMKYFMCAEMAYHFCEEAIPERGYPEAFSDFIQRYSDFLHLMDAPMILTKLLTISGTQNPQLLARANCVLLSILKPLTTMLEEVWDCFTPWLVDEVLPRYVRRLVLFHGYRPREAEDVFMSVVRDVIFGDPPAFLTFYLIYENAVTRVELREAYIRLAEVAGVTLEEAEDVIRFLRYLGAFPRPAKLLGARRGG